MENFDKNESRIIVIGASHAGVSFCDQLRKSGFKGEIILIDKQKGGPMERPPLSKSFLLESEDTIKPIYLLKRAKWYREQEVALRHGTDVTRIDAESKMVTLDNNESLKFDKLVIATGAKARNLPETEGMSKVYVLRNPSDAIEIRQAAREGENAVIVGGGYIGLEVAATLRQMGLIVSVVEVADRVLARVASPSIAEIITKIHKEHGVSLYTGTAIREVSSSNRTFQQLILTDGRIIPGDMLIVGIGVIPESDLAADAGIETEGPNGGGILVNANMQTSVSNIYAIGDVALKHGNSVRIESVHNAQDSGARAVAAIMGYSPPAYEAPRFWSDQFDANLQSVGLLPTNLQDIFQVKRPGGQKGAQSFWSYHNETLLAVETIRDMDNFILGTKCLNRAISPHPDRISDPEFDPLS